MDLYRNGKLVEYTIKKYRSHRRIPEYVIYIVVTENTNGKTVKIP